MNDFSVKKRVNIDRRRPLDITVSEEKKTVIPDEDTDFSPEENCFDKDVSLLVTEGVSDDEILTRFKTYVTGKSSLKEIYNIRFVDSEGNIVQPAEGKKVTVRIKAPALESDTAKYYVTHRSSETGSFSMYKNDLIRYENGYIVFEVDHFSYFAVCVEETESTPDSEPAPVTVESITVATLPVKTAYTYKLDSLDVTGLALTVTYSDGATETVTDTSKMTVSGFDSGKTGAQKVTVEYEGASAEFEVTFTYVWWQWIIRILLLGFLWY
ncbi:MAG: bacterial Ig-like domain-containing protein [Clostridia bacterium]|nr:bacterial Ig-like domain-containing protein [Clostridia bacterium]